jgi:hypothetical protein
MQIIPLFFAVLIFIGMIFNQNLNFADTSNANGEAMAISGSMEVYRNCVLIYAQNNPAATGTVADSALNLPSWFVKMNGVSNYVTGGKGYVWYATTQPVGSALTSQILQDTNNLINVGIDQNGVLFNPIAGTTTITLPATIPNGSVVIADN